MQGVIDYKIIAGEHLKEYYVQWFYYVKSSYVFTLPNNSPPVL